MTPGILFPLPVFDFSDPNLRLRLSPEETRQLTLYAGSIHEYIQDAKIISALEHIHNDLVAVQSHWNPKKSGPEYTHLRLSLIEDYDSATVEYIHFYFVSPHLYPDRQSSLQNYEYQSELTPYLESLSSHFTRLIVEDELIRGPSKNTIPLSASVVELLHIFKPSLISRYESELLRAELLSISQNPKTKLRF